MLAGMPILRHYSAAYKYYGAVPGAQLIVRMISTVFNYDYIQDLVLGVDGTIDVRVTTSGYIQSTTARGFYPQHFGFPLAQNVTGEKVLYNDCNKRSTLFFFLLDVAGCQWSFYQCKCSAPAAL